MGKKYRLISPGAYDYRIQVKEKWWHRWRTIERYYLLCEGVNERMRKLIAEIK